MTPGARRVLFVNPGIGRGWGTDFTYKELLPSVGIEYVAGAARAAGHQVAIIDMRADDLTVRDTVARAAAFEPDVLALSAYSKQMAVVGELLRAAKQALPGCATVLGGPHASAIPLETLEEFPNLDVAVFGEGEATIVELLAALDGLPAATVAGVALRGDDGAIVKGPDRAMATDLDRLAFPAFDLLPRARYYAPYLRSPRRSLTLTTARGCPYRCVFCANPGGLQYRYRSIESVMEEIERDVFQHGAEVLLFTDETFTLNRKRTVQLCEAMLRKGYPRLVQWICGTRVDAVDPELLALMRRAGCYAIFFGVESGDEGQLETIKKKIDREEAIQAIRWAREADIFTQTGFIIGHPDDTREKILRTVEFAVELDSDACAFSILVPYPGTQVLEMARQGIGGLRLLSDEWSGYGGLVGAALELDQLPRHQLEWLLFYAYARFYSRPRKWRGFQRSGRISAIPVVLAHIAATQVRKGLGRWRSRNGTAGSKGRKSRGAGRSVPDTASPRLEGSPSA